MAFEDLNPVARVVVSGVELTAEVLRSVIRLDIDLSRDIADQIKIRVANPSSDKLGRGYKGGGFAFIDSKIWMPGNHIDVYLGYGSPDTHVASGIIQKWLPDFPRSGIPTLDIVALDASVRLMDLGTASSARTFPEFDLGAIAVQVLAEHDIDVGEVIPVLGSFQQMMTKKAGMTDYQLLKGLANLAGFEFKIRYDVVARRWKGYWRPPTSEQAKKFNFVYMNGISTLLDFDPQWGLRDAPSEVKVMYFDKFARIWQEVSSKDAAPSVPDKSVKTGKDEDLTAKRVDDLVEQGILSLDRIRIGTGGTSIEVIAERPFENAEAAERFAARWIRQHRDNFVTGSGTVIGLETLRPGDVHNIDGVGVMLSGDWEMTTVRHIVDVGSGWVTEFAGNKVIAL